MARIVIAWELGVGYGHVSKTAPVAAALRGRGHDVVYLVRNLPRAETVLGPAAYPLLQAPIWLPRPGRGRTTHSYADVLLRNGYAPGDGPAALVHGWQELLTRLLPDLVLAEHAPTALLAARILGLPAAPIGVPFTVPPPQSPWPELQPWDPLPEADRLHAEAVALDSVNAVLREAGREPLGQLGALFATPDSFICAFAELDCYATNGGRVHRGPLAVSFGGLRPEWPDGPGPRLLLVVDASYWDLDRLMAFAAERALPTLAHVRDARIEQIARWQTGALRIFDRPLDLARLLPECDAVIAHGGQGSLHATLLAGRPILILPQHVEQLLNALLANAIGAATMVGLDREERPDYGALFEPLLADPRFAAQARAFAERHAGHDPRAAAAAIADRCEELMGPPARLRTRRG